MAHTNFIIMYNNKQTKLRQSQGVLIQQCQLMAKVVERDLSTLKDYEITEEILQVFINNTKTYENMPNDTLLRSKLSKQVEIKKQLRRSLNEQVQFILSRVANLYDRRSADFAYFGMQHYSYAKEADMVRQCRMLVIATVEYLPDLARRNIRQEDLDQLIELIDDYDKVLTTINESKTYRKQAKIERIDAGLILQDSLFQFAKLGKIVWSRIEPTKYLDYAIKQ